MPKVKKPKKYQGPPSLAFGTMGMTIREIIDSGEHYIVTFRGEDAINPEQMKEILGWEEEKEERYKEYLLIDLKGKRIRCTNNTKNRPFYRSWADRLSQEHLMRRWKYNGETIIIGKSGSIFSGQHRGISQLLAEQERQRERHWDDLWQGPVTMETIIVFGMDEDEELINTLDTGKPRSIHDVIYRSHFFQDMHEVDRKAASRVAGYCVQLLWKRTGCTRDAFSHILTVSESTNFIYQHPRILECVKHIYEEYASDWSICNRRIGAGYAAAMMYLMGCSTSDSILYRSEFPHSEKTLNWKMWDKAQNFWTFFIKSPDFSPVRYAIGGLASENGEGSSGTLEEKLAILCKAWLTFVQGKNPQDKNLQLKYRWDGDIKVLDENATVGGIDLGDPSTLEDDEDIPSGPATDPNEEEIILRGEEERRKRAEKLAKELKEQREKKKEARKSQRQSKQADNAE